MFQLQSQIITEPTSWKMIIGQAMHLFRDSKGNLGSLWKSLAGSLGIGVWPKQPPSQLPASSCRSCQIRQLSQPLGLRPEAQTVPSLRKAAARYLSLILRYDNVKNHLRQWGNSPFGAHTDLNLVIWIYLEILQPRESFHTFSPLGPKAWRA